MTVAGAPGIRESPRSKRVAATWLARLDDLETVLTEENLAFLGARLEVPNFDAVPPATLRANREALLREIAVAKAFFGELAD